MKGVVCGLLFLAFFSEIRGQTIAGRITDEIDNTPLIGALVSEFVSGESTVTDENGNYLLENLAPGYATITVTYLGFRDFRIDQVLVTTGKSLKLDLEMERNFTELSEVTILSGRPIVSPGKRTINEEQINRFASTYYDPARLMSSSPDVAIANDQNNQISIRGISPAYNKWRLEGVEIVNPNHLANAGTISDQPAGTSGGVNILSAQMLGSSSLNYGVFGNELNNSVGGIFDMYLKSGVAESQFTAQASLIGFDFSSEGLLSKKSNISYIANYRYSFTGLLTSMGVDFGGESIGFQDLSFAIDKPLKDGNIKFFGVGGLNFNHFDHLDFSESEREKDRKDIYADGKMGLAGVSFSKKALDVTLAYSGLLNERLESVYDELDQVDSTNNTIRDESIVASRISYKLTSARGLYEIGLVNNFYQYGSESEVLNQVYLNSLSYQGKFKIDWGITVATNSFESITIDPRLNLNYALTDGLSLFVGVGRFSQLLDPGTYLFAPTESESEYSLRSQYQFIYSNRYVIGVTSTIGKGELQTELFNYSFDNVNSSLGGEASSKGISSTYSRSFVDGWYFLGGGSLFDSKISENTNNPYNTRFSLNLAGGKDFRKVKKEIPRSFSVNGRVIYQGGKYYSYAYQSPFEGLSIAPGRLSIAEPFGSQLPSYSRFDLRFQWTKSKPNSTRVIALDIQNMLMTENIGFYYYDRFLGEEQESLQLGLIPILTYRYEF